MVKNIIPALAIVILLASCSNLKPLASAGNKPAATVQTTETSKQVKFLDNISATSEAPAIKVEPAVKKEVKKETQTSSDILLAKNERIIHSRI